MKTEPATYGIIDPDYARVFTVARCIAWSEGYALTMHGSFTRDLDLLAVPWTEKATEPEHLVSRIVSNLDDLDLLVKDPKAKSQATQKPHGRLAWTLTFKAFGDPRFVDLSVMPRDASGEVVAWIDSSTLPLKSDTRDTSHVALVYASESDGFGGRRLPLVLATPEPLSSPATGEVGPFGAVMAEVRRATVYKRLMTDAQRGKEAAEAKLAQAVEALEPFADFAEWTDDEGWTCNIHREAISVWFGPSDFRRARSASARGGSNAGTQEP